MENTRIKFYVEKTSFWPQAAAVLLGLASVFQFVGCWGLWSDRFFALTQMLLPVAAFLLYAALLMLLGKKALWLTALPFLAGVGFYAVRVWFEENRLLLLFSLAFCVVAAVLYLGTVFTLIRTKWLLVLLFGGAFLYRAFYRDVLIMQHAADTVSFSEGMREMSLLCVLLAMALASLGMRKRVKERKNRGRDKTPAPAEASATLPAPETAPVPAPAPVPEAAPAVEPVSEELTEDGFEA